MYLSFFFFNDTATTEIYTLSLHDALPIFAGNAGVNLGGYVLELWNGANNTAFQTIVLPNYVFPDSTNTGGGFFLLGDRKSTRLNSSHANNSYAVFCLKKKKKQYSQT